MADWHHLYTTEVLKRLGTDEAHGLTQQMVKQRIAENGLNELVERPPKSPWVILWEQLTDTMVLVLIVAAGVSAFLQDFKEAIAILAIVIFSALLGFTQEYRAVQAFASLRKLAVPKVRVYRDDSWVQIFARDLVSGDIVQLEAGNQVAADCRLLEVADLRVLEAAFTGESEPVDKSVEAIPSDLDLVLSDRTNMVYKGTVVTYGRGKAVVTETGMNTELGKLTDQIQSVQPEITPLQRRLNELGKQLAIAAFLLVVVIFVLGVLRGGSLEDMLLTAVSLAVAVIPESLAAVVTIALALGAQRMLKRNALIRKLTAVETLGSVTVICSDKTGTLTQNVMTVTVLNVAGQRIDLMESLMRSGMPRLGSQLLSLEMDGEGGLPLQSTTRLLLTACALCNDVLLPDSKNLNLAHLLGDPTEVALVVAATQLGLHKPELEPMLPRVDEVPFDSDRKRMTTIHHVAETPLQWRQETGLDALEDSPYVAFTKGGIGSLLEISTKVWLHDRVEPLTPELRDRIRSNNDELAQAGNRVLAFAMRSLHDLNIPAEEDLTFIGLIGMMDPPRPEVKLAIETCLEAGIRPIMITGDQALTARHIAQELGISLHEQVLTGRELNQLDLDELKDQVEIVSVYARVAPDQKLKIVQALQERGQIVAMTGDGVNDAPALKKADIGVAMGITGTDVAKDAADVVLLDDNFATIVAAVEQGRVIFDNIRKFIKYSMTGNASSLWLMMLAPLLAMPLPLLPLQILWINLLADGLLSLALSFEPAERNTMRRPPFPPNASIFNREMVRDIVWVGMLLGVTILALGFIYWDREEANWQTIIFSTLAFSRMSLALAMRSQRDSLFRIGILTNLPMLGAVLLTFVLQLSVIYLPWFHDFFATRPMTGEEIWVSLGVSTIGFWAVEIEKLLLYRRPKPKALSRN